MDRPRRRSHLVFLTVLVSMVALDLWSKAWAFAALDGPRDVIVVWEGVLRLKEVENPGMMWGMAQDVPAWLWVVIRGGVLTGLLWYYVSGPRRGAMAQLAFGLVAAGAIGNVYDNVFTGPSLFEGKVRDFIDFYWFEFPTFNVADSCICVGAPLLLLVLWNQDREGHDADARVPQGAAPR